MELPVWDIFIQLGTILGLCILGVVTFILLCVVFALVWSRMIEPSLYAIKKEKEAKKRYNDEINNPETARHYSKTNWSQNSVKPTDNKQTKKRRRKPMRCDKKNFYDRTNIPFTTIPGYVVAIFVTCIMICIMIITHHNPVTSEANATESTETTVTDSMFLEEPVEPATYDVDMFEEILVPPCKYTEEELDYCKWIVEAEAHDLSLHHKTLIMCVLVNRLNSDLWNYNSLKDVIFDTNQFPSTYNIYQHKLKPDEDTITAVESVLSGEIDPEKYAQGAIFFYNPDRCGGKISFFENRTFLYSLDGHRFFA